MDDDPDVQMLYTAHLQAEGYQVRSACDGISCLIAAQRDHPDLIILDLGLPAGDGETALQNIRASADLARVPVLVLSGREAEEWAEHLILSGASAYLQKPVFPETLNATVAQLLAGEPVRHRHRQATPETAPGIEPPPAVPTAPVAPELATRQTPAAEQVGSLCCPHCGHQVAGLNATLDPRAILALAQAQLHA